MNETTSERRELKRDADGRPIACVEMPEAECKRRKDCVGCPGYPGLPLGARA